MPRRAFRFCVCERINEYCSMLAKSSELEGELQHQKVRRVESWKNCRQANVPGKYVICTLPTASVTANTGWEKGRVGRASSGRAQCRWKCNHLECPVLLRMQSPSMPNANTSLNCPLPLWLQPPRGKKGKEVEQSMEKPKATSLFATKNVKCPFVNAATGRQKGQGGGAIRGEAQAECPLRGANTMGGACTWEGGARGTVPGAYLYDWIEAEMLAGHE
eukprot:1157805-Pelagomonas_calceolata.AAC.21